MICLRVILSVPAVGLLFAQDSGAPKVRSQNDFFETRIRPLLAKNCFACHTGSKLGGLRLDSRDTLLKGGNTGPAVTPGDADGSLIIQAVRRTHPRIKMPPTGKLRDEEIGDLTAWVKAGAIWPEAAVVQPPRAADGRYVITPEQRAYWAFQPFRKPNVPVVKDSSWARSEIDRFILAKLEERGLKPVKPADKRVLLRRATFDLIGLPPRPEEVDAFLSDNSPNAFSEVVDRLLASPHYGERWGRYWLDYARYADDKFGRGDTKLVNAFRYRDWVIRAFNEDMPYDLFVKAQIAADLLDRPDREKLLPALGFYGLSPEEVEDRVDVTTRVFLGLTVGCARCHHHKFDPIPTEDYYALLGVIRSSPYHEIPLAPEAQVTAYHEVQKRINQIKEAIKEFTERETNELAEMLAKKTAGYMVAAWQVTTGVASSSKTVADQAKLDQETLERWIKYLKTQKEHEFLRTWDDAVARKAGIEEIRKLAADFQALVLSVNAEKKAMDDRNYVALGGAAGMKVVNKRQYTNVESLEIKKYYLWRDLASDPYMREGFKFEGGVYYYGPKHIERFLSGAWKEHLQDFRAELAALEKALPPRYPFLHAIHESEKPANAKVEIRGEPENLGAEVPRRFMSILCNPEPIPFTKGSGRLELAEAIASPKNPLTARVIVNRIWQLHFGQGIVRTPSNFGMLGERPTHPELLDYLAARFVEGGWSMKALHREIMLSSVYGLSSGITAENIAQDPDNRLLWRANVVKRLDAEALRDAMLAVAGTLDQMMGGAAAPLDDKNRRRAVYGFVSRNQPDAGLALFDFPDANATADQRVVTAGPLQRLYFMNSSFVVQQAKAVAERLQASSGDDMGRIITAYKLLYGRRPTEFEIQLGLDFVRPRSKGWPQYAQMLLASAEFSSLN